MIGFKTTKIVVDNVGQQNARDFWKQFDNMQDKINNLQSKIDKAIEYIEKYLEEHVIEDQPDEQSIFYDEKGRYIPNAKEQLLSILKEDK